MAKIAKNIEIVQITKLERATVDVFVLGTTPLVMNRMPKKAREELLLPKRETNRATRRQNLKHDPIAEFRDAVYRCRDDAAPTLVHMPENCFKKAMAQAAVDIPGARKAEIGRLVQVVTPTVHIYGKPFLYMSVVRLRDINRTPDIHTRAIFPEWACSFQVRYVRPQIREQDIVNLLDNAGTITGIGDGRAEKGTYDKGSWELVHEDNKRWLHILQTQGRKVQQAALDNPECYDLDTEELFAWFNTEIMRREQSDQVSKPIAAAIAGNGRRKPGRKAQEVRT